MTYQFCIKSAYRSNYDTTTANLFTVSSGTQTLRGKWLVTSAQVPVSAYTIDTPNNIINFHDTANRVVTIPPGYYTVTSLATAIQTAMNTAGGSTYTVTVDNASLKITVAGSTNFYFTFGANLPPNYYNNPSFALANILGLGINNTTPAAQITGTNPINLNYNQNLNITIQGTSYRNVDCSSSNPGGFMTGNKNYSFEIPIGGIQEGTIYQYIPNNQLQVIEFVNGVQVFNVTVVGDDDQPYNFNGANLTITMSKL